jgi:predicted nuclease of predicted toxin-antitoxin system
VTKLRFKLDENLHALAAHILQEAGYDAVTVNEQAMGGCLDDLISNTCVREGRCIVTMDLHFSNILVFPPKEYAGIVVLRHPRMRLNAILALIHQFVDALKSRSPAGELWIVEPGRIRIHSD